MFPSMMIYRRRLLQASQTALVPCLPLNNTTTTTPNSLDLEHTQITTTNHLDYPLKYVASPFTTYTAVAFFQSIHPYLGWQLRQDCGHPSMLATIVHCQIPSQPDADFFV
ncbi:hypothetical protein FJTKL_07797 [Diaporthe vaccinii]|uniref:Uncharacterized protein n=1 Tax=Diaporthe vaccinii TaxID=105482 RepID=A0ABR4FDT2_9PEZI